jgi:hypothetical protein
MHKVVFFFEIFTPPINTVDYQHQEIILSAN